MRILELSRKVNLTAEIVENPFAPPSLGEFTALMKPALGWGARFSALYGRRWPVAAR